MSEFSLTLTSYSKGGSASKRTTPTSTTNDDPVSVGSKYKDSNRREEESNDSSFEADPNALCSILVPESDPGVIILLCITLLL